MSSEISSHLRVSVVVPVYQAERFVRRAVESAVSQPEVSEVILVEDGSVDGSWKICRELAEECDKVRVFHHPDHVNLGAGASRNLAIEKAREEWIAFLDADDFMLPGRFVVTNDVIARHPDTEAVYEAVGRHFEEEIGARRRNLGSIDDGDSLTTVTQSFAPEQAFYRMAPVGGGGYVHTDGWTVHRRLIVKSGYFNPALRLHQDTDLFMRFCLAGVVRAGQIRRPVAMRGVHENNRISAPRSQWENYWNRVSMFHSTWVWAVRHSRIQAAVKLQRRALKSLQELDAKQRTSMMREWKRTLGWPSVLSPRMEHRWSRLVVKLLYAWPSGLLRHLKGDGRLGDAFGRTRMDVSKR